MIVANDRSDGEGLSQREPMTVVMGGGSQREPMTIQLLCGPEITILRWPQAAGAYDLSSANQIGLELHESYTNWSSLTDVLHFSKVKDFSWLWYLLM